MATRFINARTPTSAAGRSRVVGPSSRHSSSRLLASTAKASAKTSDKKKTDTSKRPELEGHVAIDAPPASFVTEREGDEAKDSIRHKFEKLIRESQDSICAAITEVDGMEFREDAYTRPSGGGGITRVFQGGNVWEKAGVNVSVVYGLMPPEAYRAATGNDDAELNGEGFVPFFAAGISSVMHPHNPHAPTMHFNYRYFETEQWGGIPSQWWFGGGCDITPSYLYKDDMEHFHGTLKNVCDEHDEAYFPKFKQWADDYFMIKHRGERRGCGGIFFDDLNDKPKEELFEFSKQCQQSVVPAYVPLVEKHMNDEFTEDQKRWQQARRGRYVEFNLVYDRGTTFGLKTGGRIESILMSMPLTSRWEYDYVPEKGTPEWDLLDACQTPRDWV